MTNENAETTKADPKAAIEQRRALRAEALAAAKEAQLVTDLEALDALEEEHGAARVARLDIDGWRPGWPTFVVVKAPTGSVPNIYKRYSDHVRNAKGDHVKIGAALDRLGVDSIVYPREALERSKLLEEFGGVAVSAGRRAVRFVEASEADEKKD